MDYLTYADRVYEVVTLSLACEAGWSVELTDLSAGGGLVAQVLVRDGTVTTVTQAPLPMKVYVWWTRAIAELDGTGLLNG